MKILGYLFIVLGVFDFGSSWVLTNGSPIDPIVGPDIAPYTAYAFFIIGGILVKMGGGDSDDE